MAAQDPVAVRHDETRPRRRGLTHRPPGLRRSRPAHGRPAPDGPAPGGRWRGRAQGRPARRQAPARGSKFRTSAASPANVAGGDIGRVGHDEVEAAAHRLEPAALPQLRGGSATPCRSAFSRATASACGRKIGGNAGGIGTLRQQRDGDGARAGAEIEQRAPAAISASAASIRVSVSGRGSSTSGVTLKLRP